MTIGAHPVRQAGPTPTSAKQVSPTSWSISGSPEARTSHHLCECADPFGYFLSLSVSFSLFNFLVISPILAPCLPLLFYFSNTTDLSLFSQLFLSLFPSLSLTFPNSISTLLTLSTLYPSLPNSISLSLLKDFSFALSLLFLHLYLSLSIFCSLSSSLYFCPLVAGKARKNSNLKTSPGTAPGTVSSAAPVLPNSVASNPRNALRFVLSQSCKFHDPPPCPPYLSCSRPLSLSRLSLLSLAARRSTNVDRASSQVTRRPVTPVLSVNPDVPAAVPMPRTPMRLRSKVSLTARAVQDIVKRNQRL